MKPVEWLRKAGAQGDVVDGLAPYDDWATLWRDCPRGDWLLGIAERLGAPHDALVRAAVACAKVADGDETARALIATAERWLEKQAGEAEVLEATKALEASPAMDPATEAANRAALAVGYGIRERDVLTGAPASAAESVIVASIDCGFELAMRWAHDKCATAVRTAIPWSVIEPCIARTAAP